MKKALLLFVAYSPVIIVGGQVLVNLLSFVWPSGYYAAGYYLNAIFGTNLLFAFVLLALTISVRFCRISFWAAVAECAFALLWFVRPKDDIYNILFQVIVGLAALAYIFRHYVEKFPLCNISLLISFLRSVFRNSSCSKGLKDWDDHVKGLLLKKKHGRNS